MSLVSKIWVIKIPIRTLPNFQEVTATYPLPTGGSMLPLVEREIEIPLSQSVPPLSTDRFQISAFANRGYSKLGDGTFRVYQCVLVLAANASSDLLKSKTFLFYDRFFDFGKKFLRPESFARPQDFSGDGIHRFTGSVKASGTPPTPDEIESLKIYYRRLFKENKDTFSAIDSAAGKKGLELQTMIETWRTLTFD